MRKRRLTKLPVLGVGPFVVEDPEITMEGIFEKIHLEEQHPIMIPLAAGREEAEPEVTMIDGAALDQGREEGLQAEHPTTLAEIGSPSAPNISPTRRASSSSSRHYGKLLSVWTSQSPIESLAMGQLNCRNHMFLAGLSPLSDDMDSFMIGFCLSVISSTHVSCLG